MNKAGSVIRFLLFVIILGAVSLSVYRVLQWKDTRGINGLYRSPSNSVDVLFVGSSHSYYTINTAILWEEYGIAANDFGEAGQRLPNEYYYLVEALKTQHPKVVFVELYELDVPYSNMGVIYRNILNMKWSDNYLSNMNAVIKLIDEKTAQTIDLDTFKKGMLLKYPMIHTRYRELSMIDFVGDNTLMRYTPRWSTKEYKRPAALQNENIAELTEAQIQTFDKLVELSEKYGFQLVFWTAPYVLNAKKVSEFNAVAQYANEKGINCYTMQQIVREAKFDYSKDMLKDGSHMNNYGSEKVTRYFAEQLKSNFYLPDHRNDPEYSWYNRMAREWNVFCATHDLEVAKNLNDYTSALDQTLFEASVLDYGHFFYNNSENTAFDATQMEESKAGNLIKNTDNFEGWYAVKKKYISYPETGTVMFSASGLKKLSYSRIEGPVSLETADIIGDDEYVLSFEVMSPDWSAVSEPTTGRTGLNAVAVIFSTTDDLSIGKQRAYKFIRLDDTRSSIWSEVPTAVDDEWLQYVSVPLKFTSTKETWTNMDDGVGKYLRVGVTLRANGTVYFRNIKLEKSTESNHRGLIFLDNLNTIKHIENSVTGLYTNGTRNVINGVWELSDQVRLVVKEDDIGQAKLYNNTDEVTINDCDVCIIVVDKETGEFINKSEFSLSEGKWLKK